MREDPYSKGGYVPSEPTRAPMWVKDGLVSFDGPGGPWGRIISADEIVNGATTEQGRLVHE